MVSCWSKTFIECLYFFLLTLLINQKSEIMWQGRMTAFPHVNAQIEGEEAVGLGSKGQQGDADPVTEIHTRSFVHPGSLISTAPHICSYWTPWKKPDTDTVAVVDRFSNIFIISLDSTSNQGVFFTYLFILQIRPTTLNYSLLQLKYLNIDVFYSKTSLFNMFFLLIISYILGGIIFEMSKRKYREGVML